MINKSIFKSYDIRGIYPTELNEDVAYKIGRAFVKYTGSKNVVVGYDARLSCLSLLKALASGILAEGAQITSIGQLPTEALYFALANYNFDSGIMITASHNPKDYNGFKMIKNDGKDLTIIRGVDLLSLIEDGESIISSELEITKLDVLGDYINYVFKYFDITKIKPFKVVIDASNGVAGLVISKIKDKLPIEIIDLNFEPDGNFPNHAPNPLEPGSSNQIEKEIKKQKADFGFMFDGDADRIFLVDEEGKLVPADIVLLLLAKYFLLKIPGAGIAYNAICSKVVPEFIKKWGGIPIRTKVGFVNVREGLIKNNGVMGGELSGHYCFKDYFYMDSGMMAFLILLQVISEDPSTNGSGQVRKVSEIIKELSIYFKSAELNFEIEDKDKVLEKIKEKYIDGKQDFLDGITVEYKNWWFNVRPSNTEPLLRLTIEADTESMLESKKKELSEFIQHHFRA